jgi:hypothetical protein
MPDDGEDDDGCSCGPHSFNFLLNLYNKLGRINPKIMPDITSELLHVSTKNHLIPMLTKLMKPLAELLNNDDIFSKVNSVTGEGANEITPENYINGPEKYSIKKLSPSLLSLSEEKNSIWFWLWDALVKERYTVVLRIFDVALDTMFITLNASLHMSSTSMEIRLFVMSVNKKWFALPICSWSHARICI